MRDDQEPRPAPGDGERDRPDGDDLIVAERVQPPSSPGGDRGGVIRQTLYKQPGTHEPIPATQAVRSGLESINATTVLMDRSGAEQITADRVTLERSGAQSIDTKSAQLDHSGVVALGSDNTVLLHSSAIQVVAEEARLTNSQVLFVSAGTATIDKSRILLFAGSSTGSVSPVITARTATIAGVAAGVAYAAVRLLVRARSRG